MVRRNRIARFALDLVGAPLQDGWMIVKKYGNRRLYDTSDSKYITLEELADKVRQGEEVRVVDAKSGEDLTASTLTQILVEGRGAARLLPALDIYLNAKQGVRQIAPYNPLSMAPFGAADAFLRLLGGSAVHGEAAPQPAPSPANEIAELRRELAELKSSLRKKRR